MCLGLFGFGFVLPNSAALQDVPHSLCIALESSLVLASGISQKQTWGLSLDRRIRNRNLSAQYIRCY